MWARSSEGGARGQSGTETALAALRARATPLGPYRATLTPARAAGPLVEAWAAAEDRALSPDPCLHPDFLAAAARHDPALRDLKLLAIWRDEALCALFPLLPGGVLFARRVWRAPRVDVAASGAPFLARDEAEAALSAALDWLAVRDDEIVFEALDAASPFRTILDLVASRRGLARRVAAPAAGRMADPARLVAPANPTGAVFERAGEPASLRAAVENHLLLEAREAGAAGRPAVIQQAGAANFIRAVTRQLGRAERCRVFSLRDAAGPLAVAIVLMDGGRATLWRVASDPQRGGDAAKALIAARIARAFERRQGGALARAGGAEPARVACRLSLRPAQGPAALARRLGERLRSAATVFSRAA